MRQSWGMGRHTVLASLVLAGSVADLGAQHVRGRVREDGSGIPVVSAAVYLVDSANIKRKEAVTDTAGGFSITAAPGRYRIQVERIGYTQVSRDTLRLAPHDTLAIDVYVSPDALRMEAIVAMPAGSRLDSFHDHRRRFEKLGIGDFFDRQKLEPWLNHSVSAVLQTVPYLNALSARSGRLSGRSRRCQISYYVDGVRLRSLFGQSVDDLVRVVDLEGIEVYRGQAQLPAEYSDAQSRGCPVVAFWTRRSS